MRKAHLGGLGALVGALGLVAAAAAQQAGQAPPARKQQPTTFQGRMLAATKLPQADLKKFLAALGPAVSGSLSSGQSVEIPGLGTFRVINVPAHRDMAAGGRPIIVDGSNYVEFLPSGGLTGAANAPGATPAVSVPPFEYVPLPNSVPSSRVPGMRTIGTRQR